MVMTGQAPSGAMPLREGVTPWERVLEILDGATATYFLTTVRDDGTPHTRPVLAVWADGVPYFACGPGTAKGRNLAADGRVSFAVEHGPMDLVLEGTATRVTERAELERVAAAYLAVYDWPVTVTADGRVDSEGGAPTAGPPPYDIYAVRPERAFGFGVGPDFDPTRWTF
jgi:hypothetical protein